MLQQCKFIMMIVLLSLLIALYAVQVASARDYCGCSPGFWKNHTEVWDGDGFSEPGDDYGTTGFTHIEAQQDGKDTKDIRQDVANELDVIYCIN